MPITSAGILMYRLHDGTPQVLLTHPGGPFWRRRDDGAWMLPKGELLPGEEAVAAARREFQEELGMPATGSLHPLGRLRQRGGKWVEAFALEGNFDPAALRSNLFELEWPPRSGQLARFPEVDRVAWFTLAQARTKILPSQEALLDLLEAHLARSG
ncbi:NUDIX domain-containing protein [Frateuria soli]|uniref:NUDIX domain-containing protein n=1 Tax=Frateuria soli TaxID=1542730 RepID=UPI001E616B24|nr:NUDIX domain-containing protein [Frateuria soli]UGB36987.1 NUDIX domain-containing protein [Frateuria soli]